MIDPPTVYAGCAMGANIGAALTAFKAEHVGMLIALGSVVTGAIAWHFMGG